MNYTKSKLIVRTISKLKRRQKHRSMIRGGATRQSTITSDRIQMAVGCGVGENGETEKPN